MFERTLGSSELVPECLKMFPGGKILSEFIPEGIVCLNMLWDC